MDIFESPCWAGGTFEELLQATDLFGRNLLEYFEWDKARQVERLIKNDERWRPFLEPGSPPDTKNEN